MSFLVFAGVFALIDWLYTKDEDTPNYIMEYSQAQIDWIKSVEKNEGIKIQHCDFPEVGKEPNTVYLFHPNYCNDNYTGATYGELYQKSLCGHNLVVKRQLSDS